MINIKEQLEALLAPFVELENTEEYKEKITIAITEFMSQWSEQNTAVFLTRRNLETLLNKLDANKANPGTSMCTLIKNDTVHPVYPIIGANSVVLKALEDEEYYTDREPGSAYKY